VIIGRFSDGIVLVTRSGHTTVEAAAVARQRFATDQTPVLGFVLNDWDPRSSTYLYYGNYTR